jgi:hypothetical protein
MKKSSFERISGPRVIRSSGCFFLIFLALSAACQVGYPAAGPLAPTSMAECDVFERNLEQRARELGAQANAIHDELYRTCSSIHDSAEAVRCWDRLHSGTYHENTECGSILYNFPQQERAARFQAACASRDARRLPQVCRDKVSAYSQRQSQLKGTATSAGNAQTPSATGGASSQTPSPAPNTPCQTTTGDAPAGAVGSNGCVTSGGVGTTPAVSDAFSVFLSKVGQGSGCQPSVANDAASAGSPDECSGTVGDKTIASAELGANEPTADSSSKPSKGVNDSKYAQAAAQYMLDAADALATIKGLNGFTEPFNQMVDALSRADTAASGQVPSSIPSIERLASFVEKEENVLSQLAAKGPTDWLYASGVSDFDPSTIPTAQQYLDRLTGRLTTLRQLDQRVVPLMTTWKNVLENPAIIGGVVGSEQASTDFGLNGIAVGDIIGRLNTCSREIVTIQAQVKLARSVVY